MEEGIFTLWTLVHISSGVVLAFLLSLRHIKLIEFAGFFSIPFLFIDYIPIKIVSLVIIVISGIALATKHFSKRKKELHFNWSIIVTLFLLILWELFEYSLSPIIRFGEESLKNRISDVIVGLVGFLITYIFIHLKRKHKKNKHRKKSQ